MAQLGCFLADAVTRSPDFLRRYTMRLSQKTLYQRAYVELQNHALPKLCLFVAKPISKERYAIKRKTRPS